MQLKIITDRDEWNNTLKTFPAAHVLQSWEWGEFKQRTTGWTPHRLAFVRDGKTVAMASVGLRRIGFIPVMYAPKGPVVRYEDTTLATEVIAQLEKYARQKFALWLKIDPDVILATGVPGEDDDTANTSGQAFKTMLEQRGWRFSTEQVQFRNTVMVDLTRSEDDILAAMSGNTRRKVRTGEKKGVTVRSATLNDLDVLYDLYHATGSRDNFLIRPRDYYVYEWRYLMEAGLAHALIAEFEQKPIAHVILFHFGETCWYFYGASADSERERMPNYALQWEAMRWAKAQGYARYDMWGAPDEFNEQDPMWGVYEFKRGFRGTVTRHLGAWDYAPFPFIYQLYAGLLPKLRNLLRSRKA